MSTPAANERETTNSNETDPALEAEKAIVWQEDPEQYEYVRETTALTQKTDGSMPNRVERGRVIIGYATIDRDAAPTRHAGVVPRRYFWLKRSDRPCGGDAFENKAPAEAVDPLTVAAGVPGKKTARAKGRDA